MMNRRTLFKKLAGFFLSIPLIGKLDSWRVIRCGSPVCKNDPIGKLYNPADYQGEWTVISTPSVKQRLANEIADNAFLSGGITIPSKWEES